MQLADSLAALPVWDTLPDEKAAIARALRQRQDLRAADEQLVAARRGVSAIEAEGPLVRVSLDCGFNVAAVITRPAREELGLATGDQVVAIIKATAVHLIPRG